MQRMSGLFDGRTESFDMPPPVAELFPGVPWGRFDALFTPAYWAGQAWQHARAGTYAPGRLGRTLAEEVTACILCGHGMPSELGLSAFERMRALDLISHPESAEAIETALRAPFRFGARFRRYRFPRMKARALAAALPALRTMGEHPDDRVQRDALTRLPGVGLKTASWIVRNMRASNDVAIIDVHIVRAGRIAGFIDFGWTPSRNYSEMETAFLRFARALGVDAAVLDGLMWDHMRLMGGLAREAEALAASPAGAHVATPIAAAPQATTPASSGKTAATASRPNGPSGQKPRPDAVAQR